MENVMALFIGGEIHLFKDYKYSSEERKLLNEHAQNMQADYAKLETLDNNEICEWYIQSVKDHLGISLISVNISFIVRINK